MHEFQYVFRFGCAFFRYPNATANSSLYQCCSGLCIDLLMQLGEKIGFEYDLFQVEDEKFGAFDKVKNCCPNIQGFTLRPISPGPLQETHVYITVGHPYLFHIIYFPQLCTLSLGAGVSLDNFAPHVKNSR